MKRLSDLLYALMEDLLIQGNNSGAAICEHAAMELCRLTDEPKELNNQTTKEGEL